MVDVTMIGTSALLPTPERALASAFLACSGRGILFDCGEGTQTAMRKAGVSLMKTDLIALTHYHGDHIFGLPGLLQTMGSLERTRPLYITGPGDLAEAMEPILRLTDWVPYEIRLLPLPEGGLPLSSLDGRWPAGASLSAFPTVHRVPSRGYCFRLARAGRFDPARARALGVPQKLWGLLQRGEPQTVDGRVVEPADVCGAARRGIKVVYGGDTLPCPALTAAAAGADLLICEATYAEDESAPMAEQYGHTTFRQAAETAAEAGAKRLWLTHFSQSVKDPEAYLETIAGVFPATECGFDGKRTALYFED
ncbi:MAG: ribonuclease Z [Clostridia bacterium]|nr:ribonuclease Z [Clostridia bacterium]